MLTAREFLNSGEWDTVEQVKISYLKLARRYHPDKNGGTRVANVRFQIISAAWEAVKQEMTERIFPVWDHVAPQPTPYCKQCGWPWENQFVCQLCGEIVSATWNDTLGFREVFWKYARLYTVNKGLPIALAHKIYRKAFGKDPVTNGTRFLQE